MICEGLFWSVLTRLMLCLRIPTIGLEFFGWRSDLGLLWTALNFSSLSVFLSRGEGFVCAISLSLDFFISYSPLCVCVFHFSQIVTEIYDLEIPSNVPWRFFFLLQVSSFLDLLNQFPSSLFPP